MKHDLRLSELKAESSVNVDDGRIGSGNTRLGTCAAALVKQAQRSFIEGESGDAQIIFGVDCGQPYIGHVIFKCRMQESDRFTQGTDGENFLARGAYGQCRTHPVNISPVRQFPGKAGIGVIPAELECFACDAIDSVKIVRFRRTATKTGNFGGPHTGQNNLKIEVNRNKSGSAQMADFADGLRSRSRRDQFSMGFLAKTGECAAKFA